MRLLSGLLAGVGFAVLSSAATESRTVRVAAEGDLQATIDQARPGDVILLEPGVTYTGNFVLPRKDGSQYITIKSAAPPIRFPANGRVSPEHAEWMPTLRSPNSGPAIATAAGAHHWRLQWLAFEANRGGDGNIIALGGAGQEQRDLASVPYQLVLDGLVIRGDPVRGQKRAIALNSASTMIRNCDIRDIKATGVDSQAIAGWNGPGPYLIENNYLEAAGENIMFGGGDPSIRDLVPSDITVVGNYLTKPLAWRGDRRWTVKNLFELKNARRVAVEWNVLEHNWLASQTGYAVLFTPVNQEGGAPWSVVSDVTFQHNVVRHVAAAINILGYDYRHQSHQTRGIRIRENLFYDVDASRWGGDGRFLLIGDEPADIIIDHNTVIQSGSILHAYGDSRGQPRRSRGFQFTNNLVLHNEYGILGDNRGMGRDTLEAYFIDALVRRNVLAGGRAQVYPADNLFPSREEFFQQFVDADREDYRVKPDSSFRTAGTGGTLLGADVDRLLADAPLRESPGRRRERQKLPGLRH